jgi:hypothetical protein
MTASRKALIIVAAFVLMALGLPWGGNVPAAFAQISVTAADPPSGEQGTLNLSVTLKGKGFKADLLIRAMTLQPDGKVIVGGRVIGEQGLTFAALGRLWR